ncbi:MAG: hypothetical protein MUO76_08205 [Anaerolineaceae bacterium]|nr:hypothetical protein [Anaerolineaceae bacterium]
MKPHRHLLRTGKLQLTGGAAFEAKFPLVAIGIFISSIFARSLIGNTAGYSLEKSLVVLVFLSLAACAGKALGGIIAD